MKSLFLRIFLSFWVAQALFVVLAILVTVTMRPRSSTWEGLLATALNDSVYAYEQGGRRGLRDYLDNLERTQRVRGFLFDENMEEISQRGAPEWAARVAAGRPRPLREGFFFPAPPPVLRDSRASSDGSHRYTLVLAPPPGPRLFLGPRGLPIPGLIIAVISSGLVCYFLAWYLTQPVVRLRAATRQLAAGDLTARTGAPASKRRDEVAVVQGRADAGDDRLLAGAGVNAAEDFVLPVQSRDAFLERANQLHPVVELEFLLDSRRGFGSGTRAFRLRHGTQSPGAVTLSPR